MTDTPTDGPAGGRRRIVDSREGVGIDTAGLGNGVPDFVAARQHVSTEVLRFAHELRAAGVDVPATGGLDAVRALAVVGLADEGPAAAALRATLLADEADIEAFEAGFPRFWHRLRSGLDGIATDHEGRGSRDGTPEQAAESTAGASDGEQTLPDARVPDMQAEDAREDESQFRIPTEAGHTSAEVAVDTGADTRRRYSATGTRAVVDAESTPLSAAERAAVDRFGDAIATLPGRRSHADPAGERLDVRRALRSSLQTGGAPVALPTRRPVDRALRCCLCLDVSGSVLDTIDRSAVLAVADRLVERARRARVFMFDTELVETTVHFERHEGDPAAALRAAEVQWGGGTQIGAAFETLRTRFPDAVDRRTVCLVVSDGLDVGEEATLRPAVTWLATRAAAVIWLNPLAVSPRYEPTSRGMACCLPYIDGLFGFSEPTDLAEVARQLEHRGFDGSIGYQFDGRPTGAVEEP